MIANIRVYAQDDDVVVTSSSGTSWIYNKYQFLEKPEPPT